MKAIKSAIKKHITSNFKLAVKKEGKGWKLHQLKPNLKILTH
tara:strand:+ start:154 stop:279 length:126 start_codon:yes stop_codon:yes gene_type:complete